MSSPHAPLAQEAFLRAVLDSIGLIVFAKDTGGRYTFANPLMCALHERPESEIIGRDDRAFFHGETLAMILANDRQVLEKGVRIANEEVVRVGESGEMRIYDVVKCPIRDAAGRIIGLAGTAKDITATRLLEHQLRAQRQQAEWEMARYRKFFESASEVMTICGADGFRQAVNPAYYRTLGYSEAEMLSRPFMDFVHPEDRDRHADAIARLLRGEQLTDFVDRFICKDGSVRWLSWNATYNANEDAIYSVGRDITAYKESERAILAAKEIAESASRAKSQFISSSSHDLRQPVLAIGLLLDALAPTLANNQQQHLARNLTRCVHSLRDMLNTMLSIAKLDAGAVTAHLSPLPSSRLANWLDAEFSSVFVARKLRLKLFYPRRDLDMLTDEGLLQNMLRNLIDNALKFCERGGVLVAVRRRGQSALIQVWDTGVGIPPGQLNHIFDEFYQIGNDCRSAEKGVGLGLSIVLREAQLIGAQLICQSRLGKGTVFSICIPLATSPAASPSPGQAADAPALTRA